MFNFYCSVLLVFFFSCVSTHANAYFIENRGQLVDQNGVVNNQVLFIHHQAGLKVQLTQSGFSYQREKTELSQDEISRLVRDENSNCLFNIESFRIDFDFGRAPERVLTGRMRTERFNYYSSGRESKGIRQYEKITYYNIQDGIDIEFLINSDGHFKYNIVAHNYLSFQNLNVLIHGTEEIAIVDDILIMNTPLGLFNEEIPMSYLVRKGNTVPVDVKFKLTDNNLSFYTEPFSNNETLVIDPQPEGVWGSYFGGTEFDIATALATDNEGNVFQTGITMSNNMATTGAHEVNYQGGLDGFAAKYDAAGNLLWSTYYGGDQTDRAYGITTDPYGNVYVGGATYSEFGLATFGSYQDIIAGMDDIFIVKFDTDGIRDWATYIGGTGHDFVTTLKHHGSKLYVTGHTKSTSGISTPGTFLPDFTANETGYLICLNDLGTELIWGTYIGANMTSSGEDIEVTDAHIYLGGRTSATSGIATQGAHQSWMAGFGNGFLQKFNNDGTIVWGTYYGGEFTDRVYGLASDNEGYIYIAGDASSTTNISSPGAYQETRLSSEQGFLAKFDQQGVRQWGTYVGGTFSDYVSALTSADSVLILAGNTLSLTSISSPGAYQETLSGDFDGFLNGFNTSGQFLWGTYFGGELGEDISAVTAGINGNIYGVGSVSGSLTGISFGNSAQQVFGGGSSDGFLFKFCLPSPIQIHTSNGYLIASGGDEYEWYLDGESLGVFGDSILLDLDGSYSASASSDGKCLVSSNEYIYSTVQLEENDSDYSISLFPNPISHSQLLTIESTPGILSVEIYTLQGQKLISNSFNQKNTLQLEITNFNKGIYIVRIITKNNQFDNKLVIH